MINMPRIARVKNPVGVYHVMVRSISDVPLFRDNKDKDKFMNLIKKYQHMYLFKVYSYCLMTTHGHIAIDCCGADISKFMKSINQCYAAYFNKRYKRHGHVFQDRFKSKLVEDDAGIIQLSVYIHNNPLDMKAYKDKIEKYKYSSLGVYLNLHKDELGILDTTFVLQLFSNIISKAKTSYLEYINRTTSLGYKIDIEFKNEGTESRNERKILIRNIPPKAIVDFIGKYKKEPFNIHVKYIQKNVEGRALSVLALRCLCDFTMKDICNFIGDITASSVSNLCAKGYVLITENQKYKNLFDDLIEEYYAA